MNAVDARLVERDEEEMIAAIPAGDRDLDHKLIQPCELSVYRMALSAGPGAGRCRRADRHKDHSSVQSVTGS